MATAVSGISTLLIIIIILAVIILPALIVAQIYLSKKQNQTYGYIMPVASFALSVIVILFLGVINNDPQDFGQYFFGLILWFILLNIPTVIFLVIQKICQAKTHARKEIDKMNIQDLN